MSSELTSVTWSKHHMAFRTGASHFKSAPCLVWCPRVFCRLRYNVCNFSRDLIWPPPWGVMRLYRRELLPICHHLDKSFDHKYYDSEDVMFLICYVTSCEYIFTALYEFMGGNSSWRGTTLRCLVAIGLVQVEI